MTTTALQASLPPLPWDLTTFPVPTLTVPTQTAGVGTDYYSDPYSLRFSPAERVVQFLTAWKEVYSVTLEVRSEVMRPVSSDYDPYPIANIVLSVVARHNDGKVEKSGYPLATLSAAKYPDTEMVKVLRERLESVMQADSQLSRWWNRLLTETTVATDAAKEQARTDVILALIEDERERLKTAMYDSPRKGQTTKVVRGRKIPIGTEGKLIWVGQTKFGKRVGIKDATETVHWTAWGNIEFTDPVDEATVLANAKKRYTETYAAVFGAPRT